MAAPARFPGGVTNATRHSTLWNYFGMDPTKAHVFFDDFDYWVAGDWTVQETGGGGTVALTDIDGGGLLITNDAGASDAEYLQKVGESFLLASGKRAWFKGRVKASHATTASIIMGLQVTDTTPLDATDGIWFVKPAAGTTWNIICRLNATTGSTTATGIATCVADTFMSLGWYYDGKTSLEYYVNDVKMGSITTTGFLPDTELTVSFGMLGASLTATFDYVFAANER